MKNRMRIKMAVVLALILGGSGCYSFGNVSEAAGMPEAAETAEASEAAGMAVSSGSEESAAEESSLPIQAEQNDKSGAVETETEQETLADTESSDEEQQELQESLEGTGNSDNADASGNEETPYSSAGTGSEGSSPESTDGNGDSTVDSSKESTDGNGSSETDGSGETPDQSSGLGTDAVDVSSDDNVEESGSTPSSGQDSNASVGRSEETSDQNASSVSDSDADTGMEGRLPGEGNVDGIIGESAVEGLQGADVSGNSAEEEAPVLEMPQEIKLVIDPWEIDGRGQVYSDQYVIKNNGENRVKLNLYGLACRPEEQSGVIVSTDRETVHDGDSKAIYMELLFGNGDSVAFAEEESEYTVELEPGEELVLWFAGELNENASQDWRDSDIKVSIMYQWDDTQQEWAKDIGESATEGSNGEAVYGTAPDGKPVDGTGTAADGDAGLEKDPVESGSASEGMEASGDENAPEGSNTAEAGSMSADGSSAENGGVASDGNLAEDRSAALDGGSADHGSMDVDESSVEDGSILGNAAFAENECATSSTDEFPNTDSSTRK